MKLKMSSIEEQPKHQQREIKSAGFMPLVGAKNTTPNNGSMNKIETRNVHSWYSDFHVLRDINMEIKANTVTALIGPSGCGKSTYLRVFNRMNDLIDGFRLEGEVSIDNKNIYSKEIHINELRKRVGMVFQKPNPF